MNKPVKQGKQDQAEAQQMRHEQITTDQDQYNGQEYDSDLQDLAGLNESLWSSPPRLDEPNTHGGSLHYS